MHENNNNSNKKNAKYRSIVIEFWSNYRYNLFLCIKERLIFELRLSDLSLKTFFTCAYGTVFQ